MTPLSFSTPTRGRFIWGKTDEEIFSAENAPARPAAATMINSVRKRFLFKLMILLAVCGLPG